MGAFRGCRQLANRQGQLRELDTPQHLSAMCEPARPAGPAGDQAVGEQQDGCPHDGGEPSGQVEEPVQGVNVEQLCGHPAAEQRPSNTDQGRTRQSAMLGRSR